MNQNLIIEFLKTAEGQQLETIAIQIARILEARIAAANPLAGVVVDQVINGVQALVAHSSSPTTS